jgi:hypothetical protein
MRVGIVADLHEPFTHPRYMDFVKDTFEAWQVDHIHFIGDIIDSHALGFWDHDPNGMSAGREQEVAYERIQLWRELFPIATVSIGNHDERHYRVARKAGLPDNYLKGYQIVWGTPKWDWEMSHIFDGVLYEHGTGTSGKDGAFNRAMSKRCSLVMGHIHAWAGVKFHASDFSRIFAMQVGAGIDIKAYSFAYGMPFPNRPVLGCGIVIDGEGAYFEPMPCGPGEKYHK